MVSVPARRGQVVYATGRGLSQRRACTLVQVGRSALHYRSRKAVKNAAVIARMQELSAQYPRFGYRRVRIFLGRDGFAMSPGQAHRLWRVAKLQVPRKRPRKRIASSRPRPQTPVGPNQVWAFDFVFDACADGRQLKCLTVTDEFTKEGLAVPIVNKLRLSVPVVYVFSGDPVSAGFADSLALPRGNMTGLTFMAANLNGKRLEILREIMPDLRRVAIIANPEHPGEQIERGYSEEAAQRLGLDLGYFPTTNHDELVRALARIDPINRKLFLYLLMALQSRTVR